MSIRTIHTLLILLICGWPAAVHAQYDRNENKIWVFGARSGIDFNGPVPVAFTSSIGTTSGGTSASQEGCATVADANGNLLFHTEGTRVWNANGDTMVPFGNNILGFNGSFGGNSYTPTYSSAQSAVICPVPDSAGQYFIFSLTDANNAVANQYKLYCNKVNMSMNNGLGGIDPNFPLRRTVVDQGLGEKITLVAGPCFTWLLVYTRDAHDLKAYQITKDGVNPTPVISNVGKFPVAGYYSGTLKASPNGRLLINTLYKPNPLSAAGLELYDFDYTTGIASNARTLDSLLLYYAADFSPDNSKVYATEVKTGGGQVYQFDLSNPNSDSIRSSKIALGRSGLTTDIRLAPNGKLYFGLIAGTYSHGNRVLASIENPNAKGVLAQYKDSAIVLDTLTGIMIGLPNVAVVVNRNAKVLLDTVACYGFTGLKLSVPGSNTYLWSTGATDSTITVTQSGVYYVSYEYQPSCMMVDTFKIEANRLPQRRTALDTLLCPGFGQLTLSTPANSNSHMWSTGATDSVLHIAQQGIYYVTYDDRFACERTDTFKIVQQDFPQWQITVRQHVLGVSRSFDSYQWLKDNAAIPGATDSTYTVNENGLFGVVVGYGICADTQYYRVNNVGVDDLSAQPLRVYPNPASDVVYLDTDLPVHVTLYDMEGREVLAVKNARQLRVGSLPQGMYLMQVQDRQTGLYRRQVLVKSE